MDFLSSPVLAYCWFGIYVYLAPAIFLLLCLRTDYAIMRRQLQLQVFQLLSLWSLISAMTVVLRLKEMLLLWLLIIYQSYGILLPCPCIIPKMIFGRLLSFTTFYCRLLSFTAFYCSFPFCSHCFRWYFSRPDHGPPTWGNRPNLLEKNHGATRPG